MVGKWHRCGAKANIMGFSMDDSYSSMTSRKSVPFLPNARASAVKLHFFWKQSKACLRYIALMMRKIWDDYTEQVVWKLQRKGFEVCNTFDWGRILYLADCRVYLAIFHRGHHIISEGVK